MPEAAVKLCECGCGEPTKISKYTDCRTGAKRGQPNRFLRGHMANLRSGPFHEGRERENAKREAAVVERRKVVEEAYLAEVPTGHIAAELGETLEVIARDIGVLRERGVDLPYRCIPTDEYVDEATASEIESAWSNDEASTVAIAARYGWSKVKAQTVLASLRRAGYRIDPRYALPIELSSEEKRAVKREYKKRIAAEAHGEQSLSQKQRVILRVFQAAKRPLAVREAAEFLAHLGEEKLGTTNLQSWLPYMQRRGLIDCVEVPRSHRLGKKRWFVPLGAEQPAEKLTLADAKRETELAALIESQRDELKRGDWIDSEKGHWADKSIDAPLTEDGFTILDTLADQDDVLAEMGQAA